MSPAPHEGTQQIFLIRAARESGRSPDNLVLDLEKSATPVESCPDVYRGLARVLRAPAGVVRAVVVCVDDLGKPEMGFFAIVGRARPTTDVYVYGDPRSRSRIDDAIELGATGRLTADVVRELAAAQAAVRPVNRTGVEPRADVRTAAHREVALDVPTQPVPEATERGPGNPHDEDGSVFGEFGDDEEMEAEAASPVSGEDERDFEDELADPEEDDRPADDDVTVRVPWLRYEKRPPRTSPGDRPAPADEPPPGVRRSGRSTLREPLLTDEELRALLGDDIPPPPESKRSPNEDPLDDTEDRA